MPAETGGQAFSIGLKGKNFCYGTDRAYSTGAPFGAEGAPFGAVWILSRRY